MPQDFIVREDGIKVRYLRLREMSVPYDQTPAVSGLRVFGIGKGRKPAVPEFKIVKKNELDMQVEIEDTEENTTGYNIIWGHAPEKLYHSLMTFNKSQRVGALVAGEKYYVRVDAFNENGITEGQVKEL